jgi:hypothetical protein
LGRNFQFAADSFGREIGGAAKLIGNQLTDDAGTEARPLRRHHVEKGVRDALTLLELASERVSYACPDDASYR